MIHPNMKFWRAVGTYIGGVVGVGVFGLPYAFAQSGLFLGTLVFIFISFVVGILLLMYGEVVLHAHDRHRLVGHVKKYLGGYWGWVSAVILAISLWGAMLAYMIVGGHFLHILLDPVFGGSDSTYSLLMGFAAAALIYRGLRFVSRLEVYVIGALLLLFTFLIIVSFGSLDLTNVATVNWPNFFLPYGVILFAFGGLGSIPEMKDVLGRQQRLLGHALVVAMFITGVLYLLFSWSVVGATGSATTQMALTGLLPVIGLGFGLVTALLGSITILSIFSVLGVELMDTLRFDFDLKYRRAWALTVFVPIILFILGLRQFIELVSFMGAFISAGLGVLVVVIYERMKNTPSYQKDRTKLHIPKYVSFIIMTVFIIGAFLEVFYQLL